MGKKERFSCTICNGTIEIEISGWREGHNAEPVTPGRCCSVCNAEVVIPARIAHIFNKVSPRG